MPPGLTPGLPLGHPPCRPASGVILVAGSDIGDTRLYRFARCFNKGALKHVKQPLAKPEQRTL